MKHAAAIVEKAWAFQNQKGVVGCTGCYGWMGHAEGCTVVEAAAELAEAGVLIDIRLPRRELPGHVPGSAR